MNVTLAYTCVTKKLDASGLDQDEYTQAARRFLNSYALLRPQQEHLLAVIACGKEGETLGELDHFAKLFIRYTGDAKDCGAYQFAALHIQTEWILFMNSHVHWTNDGAVDRLLDARSFGDYLYGPWGSYEVSPHIRTACMLVRRENLLKYPHQLKEFQDANRFECGDISFTRWMQNQGKPALMVTWDGIYSQPDWRKPQNVFRKGDQSACLMFDRHTQIYDQSGPLTRAKLEAAADGK